MDSILKVESDGNFEILGKSLATRSSVFKIGTEKSYRSMASEHSEEAFVHTISSLQYSLSFFLSISLRWIAKIETLRLICETDFAGAGSIRFSAKPSRHAFFMILFFLVRQSPRKEHTQHTHTRMQTHTHIYTQHTCFAYFWYISTIYSSTYRLFKYGENACIQHQRFSYVTVTTIIYTDYILYRIEPVTRQSKNSLNLWKRFDETKIHILRRAQ